ncbi:MAG: hypothetical protein L0Z55_00395 [Planctomycetes bacterium]|nr:hypothetical protein [Planctomycetota bacterium]
MTTHKHAVPQGPPPPAPPPLESKITSIAESIARAAKRYAMPMTLGAGVVVLAILVFFGVQRLQAWQTEKTNAEIYALLGKKPEEVRKEAPEILAKLRGEPREAVFAVEYGQWLYEQGEAEEALRVARDVRQRHEKEEILTAWISSLESYCSDNATFKLPQVEPVGPPAPPVESEKPAESESQK